MSDSWASARCSSRQLDVRGAVKAARRDQRSIARSVYRLVGVGGIEPPTSCSQNRRATAALHPAASGYLDDKGRRAG